VRWRYEVPCLEHVVTGWRRGPNRSRGVDPAGYKEAWVPDVAPGQLWPEARREWVSSGSGVAGYVSGLADKREYAGSDGGSGGSTPVGREALTVDGCRVV